MKTTIKYWALAVIALSLPKDFALAHENKITQEKGLKFVMQGLLKDTQLLNEGIFLEDYAKIELAAKNIANHPTPGMNTMKKVKENLAAEMGRFKGFDIKVHDTALVIANAASEQDLKKVMAGYHQMIDGCLSCHSQFKQRVSKLLSQK